jgi:hypothetical protein
MTYELDEILGMPAKDTVTGFSGIMTGYAKYLSGCVRVLIEPPVDKDHKMVPAEWFDVQRVDFKGKTAKTIDIGGPRNDAPTKPRGEQ